MTDETTRGEPEDVRRALAQLQAEVTALQVWRAHQSDLLDSILNSQSGLDPRLDAAPGRGGDSGTFLPAVTFGADGPDDDAGYPNELDELDELDDTDDSDDADEPGGFGRTGAAVVPERIECTAELVDWVHQHVSAVIARPLRGELRWCPRWWDHAEAVLRLTALQRAWAEHAAEPGAALSVYLRDHLDPCLRELTHPLGPFADCSHNQRHPARHAGRWPEHTPLPTLPILNPPTGTQNTRSDARPNPPGRRDGAAGRPGRR